MFSISTYSYTGSINLKELFFYKLLTFLIKTELLAVIELKIKKEKKRLGWVWLVK